MTVSANIKESNPRAMKNNWESELGYGWSSGQRRCRLHRPPESTMSVGSDIRFTRRKLSRSCRGCCAALAAMLILILLAAVATYLGHMYLFGDPLSRQTFRGSFVVSSWTLEDQVDSIRRESASVKADDAKAYEHQLRQSLAALYRASELRSCFVGADVLALDNAEEGVRVHFEVSFEPIFTAVTTAEVREVLDKELRATNPVIIRLGFLPETLFIEESTVISSQALEEVNTTPSEPPSTEASISSEEDIRECAPISLPLCSNLPYNSTSYPNLVGHSSRDVIFKDLSAFRELLDAECSHLAQDFVCQMLQPRCTEGRVVRPCRAYCRTFHAGCGDRLPDRLKPYFDCGKFPDYFGADSCSPEPNCLGGLQRLALSSRACDGVPDCADAADERSCSYCIGGLRCALTRRCIPLHLRCDGTPDCPDGSDEMGCLSIARSLSTWQKQTEESTLSALRIRSGYMVWRQRGRSGKVCAAPYQNDKKALASVAGSLCKELTYNRALNADAVPDAEVEITEDDDIFADIENKPEYVEIADPTASDILFLKSECPERKVIKVLCDELDCGIPSARGIHSASGVIGLQMNALPGDWPWHAALFRSHVHACDAALLHPSWLITTAACFQGQPKAEWTARLGTVRIQSTTPWQQERRIVGMVRSPVEGSMLALVRLEEPLEMSDFVRPICLPDATPNNSSTVVCNSLSWARNLDQLQRVHVTQTPMQRCENVSIATVNGLCAETLYTQDDCDEEEYAGSSMMCFDEMTKKWSLAGVGGWRIACTKIGQGRPRMYDSVSSHLDWIRRTIAEKDR